MKKKWYFFVLFVLLFSFFLIKTNTYKHSMQNKRDIVCGKVISISQLSKGGYVFKYEYKVNNILHQNVGSIKYSNELRVGSTIHVAVHKKKHDISFFLSNAEEYKFFNVGLDDTLNLQCQ